MRRVLLVAALTTLSLLASGAGTDGRASTARAQLPPFLWGAWIGDQFTGKQPPWDWTAATRFEARNAGGRHISAIHWGVGTPWDHQFNYWLQPSGPFNNAEEEGATSVVDMDTGNVSLRKIANGAEDSALRSWATEARTWGQPFLLRFDFEMNGQWYAWGTRPKNRNTPADFVAAWRHVHRIFTSVGATNVLWAWCPNIDPLHQMTGLARLYPGNAYVDWTCLDGYNFGRPWTSFAKLYASSYRQILRLAPNKPMIIGEIASTGHDGNKAHWISNMFNEFATRYRHVHGLLWWDERGRDPRHPNDWPIETSRASSTAFSRGLGRTLARMCDRVTGGTRAVCLGE